MKAKAVLRISLIIPTRNRPKDIRVLLNNLADQSVRPDQVVVVDASDKKQPELVSEFPQLNICYQPFEGEPSAAVQRNAGLQFVSPEAQLVGFVDDDIVFAPEAFAQMRAFWSSAPEGVCGAAFNLIEEGVPSASALKHSRLAEKLGLYCSGTGRVALSGWHTRIGHVQQDSPTEWLISGAVLWRREVLTKHQFDAFFQGYSYLEDLDFSYGVSRKCGLMVVAGAGFEHHHHHQQLDKAWYADFGRMEVRNRLYFVRKHGLSVGRCYLGLMIRLVQTLGETVLRRKSVLLSRVRGNLVQLWVEGTGRAK